MVLKFKVWRLQWENRGPRNNRQILVLRDKHGQIRKCASTEYEQFKLRKWYEDYNIGECLENLLKMRALKEHVRKMKARIRRRGFRYQVSFYGVWINPETGERGYRRYEVFKADKWNPDEVAMLHDFFQTHVPKSRAGVFVYHDQRLFIDEEDGMTRFGRTQP